MLLGTHRVALSDEQRHALRQRTRQVGLAPSIRDRLEMVRLTDAGWSVPHIARQLGQREQAVRAWIKAFLRGGFVVLPNKSLNAPLCCARAQRGIGDDLVDAGEARHIAAFGSVPSPRQGDRRRGSSAGAGYRHRAAGGRDQSLVGRLAPAARTRTGAATGAALTLRRAKERELYAAVGSWGRSGGRP